MKNIPWSQETSQWAENPVGQDPAMSTEAVEDRLKKIQDILRRPDPRVKPLSSQQSQEKVHKATPVLEDDETDRLMTEGDHLSLEEIQRDLIEWWTDDEKNSFYKRLAGLEVSKGNRLVEEDVYEFWVAEWTRKISQVSDMNKQDH